MRDDVIPLPEAPGQQVLKIVSILVEKGLIDGLESIGISPGLSIRARKAGSCWLVWSNEQRGFAKLSNELAQCIQVTPKRSRAQSFRALPFGLSDQRASRSPEQS